MPNGTSPSTSSSKENCKSLNAANPSKPPSSTSTTCPCLHLRGRKGVLRSSSNTSNGPQSSGASPLHLTHNVSHIRSVRCGECSPRCLLPSLCGECICFGLGLGTHKFGFGHHLLLQVGGNATQPLHSPGSPTPGVGRKSELAASPLPSREPKRGQKCYVTPAFSGFPNTERGGEIGSGCLLKGPKERGMLRNPCILGGSPPPSAGGKSEVAASPQPSREPKRGRKCYVTLAFSGVPNVKHGEKIRSGCLTPAPRGPERGRNCYVTPAFLGVPKKGDKHGQCRASARRPLRAILKGGPQQKKKSGSLRTALGSTICKQSNVTPMLLLLCLEEAVLAQGGVGGMLRPKGKGTGKHGFSIKKVRVAILQPGFLRG